MELAAGRKHAHLPVDIEFQDLTYSVPIGKHGSKKILRSVSGIFRSGQLTGILGPSGAGKSTLLNVLAGYRCSEITGSVLTNGTPRDMRQFRKISRYIMQEDLVQPHLTVFEAMAIAADLKLGREISRREKFQMIEEILEILRLIKSKNTQTLRLSGGEKKRLSVALEMINNPPVIFLDEPTTGLDDLSSAQCMTMLKTLAAGGRTVICSIHTPSARLFQLFDHVYIVSQGQCVYQGAATDIVPFLASVGVNCPKHYNPADFIIEVSSGEYGPQYIEKMVVAIDNGKCSQWAIEAPETDSENCVLDEESQESKQSLESAKNEYNFASSKWMQFKVLTYRMLLQTWRNSTHLWIKFSMYIFIGLLVGGIFFQFGEDGSKTIFNFGFCYTCIIVYLYIPLMPVLLAFPGEVQIIKREYFNRWYSLSAYFCALTISKLPFQFVFGTMYFCLVYVMTGQPIEFFRCSHFLIICLLIGMVSESMGLAISSILSIVNGMFVGPSLSVPLMLLAVYGLGDSHTPIPLFMRMAMYLSYLRYGIEGLTLSVYGFDRPLIDCPPEVDFCQLSNPKELLKQTGMSDANIYLDILGLVFFLLLFKGLSFMLLRWRLSSYRSFAALNLVKRFVKTHFNFNYR